MHVVHTRGAELDVPKKSVGAAVRLLSTEGSLTTHIRTFGTTTAAPLDERLAAHIGGHPRRGFSR